MTNERPTPREAIRDLLLTVAHELRIDRAVEWLNDRLKRRPR